MNRKIKNIPSDKRKLIVIYSLIVLPVLFISIGFSVFQDQLSLSDSVAFVRARADIRVTGVSVSNPVNGGVSNYEDYEVSSINGSVTLPNNNSRITYKVEVTNFGNVEMILKEITGLPSNLKYSLNSNNYAFRKLICDDEDSTKCTLGAKKTIDVTISYNTNRDYDSTNTTFPISLNFVFESANKVALVNEKYYDTLQDAINACPGNVQTTVKLLKDTSEAITVGKAKNIIFDFQDFTVSNSGNNPVFNNNGTVLITNGTISTSASTNGAFNNQSTGVVTISGGKIVATGGRQAFYNNKGTLNITGDAYLSSKTADRSTVTNLADATLNITGGTIISTGSSAVSNAGSLTIGNKDGNTLKDSIILQGVTYGIESTASYNFYDGTLKGKTNPFNDRNHMADIEDNYSVARSEEVIDDVTYKTAYLAVTKTVTFDPNGGTVDETTRDVEVGGKVGTLPVPQRLKYEFAGWFTLADGGTEINSNQVIDDDVTFYAHWNRVNFAKIGDTEYETLQDAIDAVPSGVETTIQLLRNTTENVTINAGKNVKLNLQSFTLSSGSNLAVIENKGTIEVLNGKITSSYDTAAINNNGGALVVINGSQVISTGTRQAVYNLDGGVVEIKGDAYLSSTTSGTPTATTMERGTVQNLTGGIVRIYGGTIVGVNQQAISNEGDLTIGTDDGSVNASVPVIRGETHGLKTTGTFNFYDGIIEGINDSINGTVTTWDSNSQVTSGTTTVGSKTYKTSYLS